MGNTLCHYAVQTENDRLLSVLLSAELPMFWLPANKHGHDILSLAVSIKSRTCVKLILDRIVAAKDNTRLGRLPSKNNRFLRTLLKISDCMDDLLASFLRQFGLDDAPGVLGDSQLTLPKPTTVTVGSNRRVPRGMWNELLRENRLGNKDKTGAIRMTAKYLSIPNMAGVS